MAKIYFDGTDIIPVNQEYAAGLIMECAKHDNAAALNWAGYLYMNGIVVEKNSGIARNYFKKALDRFKPNPNAMHHLAWAYDHGKGVEKDITIALKWMTRAAAAGQTDAMLSLGKFYLEHEFRMEDGTVWKDTDAAVHWISEAAIAGSSEGAYILSHIFQGDYDLFDSVSYCFYLEDYNPELAYDFMKQAAEAGLPVAMKELADMYENGYGTEANSNAAKEWRRKAN